MRENRLKYEEVKSLPFWSWNDKLEKEELVRQIEWMNEKKMGGFFMHARAGLKTEYLSDEWFDCVRTCIEKAEELGMEAWAYDENGWPSGFVGGELLKDEKNLENFLQTSFGQSDEQAMVSYDISTDVLRRLEKGEHSDNALNVYKCTAVSSVDVMDKNVVNQFIEKTHDEYKKRLGENFHKLKGFFSDEVQFCRRAMVYPHVIEKYYQTEYGEDILDGLGLLFVEKEGYQKFRYTYWKTCQSLLIENFCKTIYQWCNEHGIKFTGHYIEERDLYTQMLYNAGIMPLYEFMHVPGIDWLCKRFMTVVPVRQLGSVAAQLNKKEVLTETFAMTGWDVTPKELKAIAEFQFLYGVNTICQHLVPYSELGERKYDHPAHFAPINPWVEEAMGQFNDYFNKLGGIMKASEEYVNVAVLHPVRSAYLGFKHGKPSSTKELDDAFLEYSTFLAKKGVGFHYLDETVLARHGFVNGAKIGCGVKEYDYLIVPKCYTMDKTTYKLMNEFYTNGGKILFAYGKPSYLEGEVYSYSDIETNVTLEEILNNQPYRIQTISNDIYSAYRTYGDCALLFVLNTDDDKTAYVNITTDGMLLEYDVITGKESAAEEAFKLKPLQSKVFIVDKTGKGTVEPIHKKEVVLPCHSFTVKNHDDNQMLLDYAEYSFDGENYSESTFISGIFSQLLEKRYEGELYLRFPFEVKSLPRTMRLLSEYTDAEIFVNANKAVFVEEYGIDKKMKLADIAPFLQQGHNEIIVKLYFYENENVYLALFGEGVTESLRNCLVYDTYLEHLVLLGDFGVYTDRDMVQSRSRDVLLADDFYIDEKKMTITEMIKDGFPFFSGRICLETTLYLSDNDVSLKIPGRIHYGKVFVNGKFAGELLFDHCLDISEFAKCGDNQIEVEIYTSARNLYGPHHNAIFDEIASTSPMVFLLSNTWKDGKSTWERKSYSLVRTGIFLNGSKEWYH